MSSSRGNSPRSPVFLALAALLMFPLFVQAQFYVQDNLVSNSSAIPANHVDPNLVNPWGAIQTGTSPFWISDQATNLSTVYNGTGTALSLMPNIPTAATPPNGPTGIVANTGSGFTLPTSTGGTVPSSFIFADLNGQIDGWNAGSTGGTANAVTAVTTPGAAYTGLAINSTGSLLYAANFKASTVDVFNNAWASQGTLPALPSTISLPSTYAPYNVADVNGTLFLAYDPRLPTGLPDVGNGNGAVIEFDPATGAYKELIAPGSGDGLNDPWGFALAPSGFGEFSNDLLVGNFGSGWISAYDPTTGQFLGYLDDTSGNPITNLSLWALEFGNNSATQGTPSDVLYITAGVNAAQTEGVFASIQPTPEPATLLLFGSGLLALGLILRRRART